MIQKQFENMQYSNVGGNQNGGMELHDSSTYKTSEKPFANSFLMTKLGTNNHMPFMTKRQYNEAV